jgi:ankyrin repeat protein
MKQRGGFKVFGMEVGRLGLTGDGLRTQLFTLIDAGSAEDFQTSLTEVLKKHNIDTITNKAGVHLLTYACTKNRLDIVEILQAKGANFSIVGLKESVTEFVQGEFPHFTFVSGRGSPLLEAISTGNRDLVNYLVDNGVNMFVRHFIYPGESDWTKRILGKQGGPLELAISLNPAVVQSLLNKYADLKRNNNLTEQEYKNLLSECIPSACHTQSLDTLRTLFVMGAQLQGRAESVRDLPDSSVAEFVMNSPTIPQDTKKELLLILITNGLDVNFISNANKSLLQTAVDHIEDNSEMAKILIDNGANTDSLDPTALAKLEAQFPPPPTGVTFRNPAVGGKRTRRRGRKNRKSRRRKSRA